MLENILEFNISKNISEEIKKDICEIQFLDTKSIRKLAEYSKVLLKSKLYKQFDNVVDKTSALVESQIWEDTVKTNQEFILDFIYIYICASKNDKSNTQSLSAAKKCLIDIINGDYITKSEWSEKNIIEFQFLCKFLNIACPIQEGYTVGTNLLWTWTIENIETFKSYMYVFGQEVDHSIFDYIEKLIICNIRLNRYDEAINLLFISNKSIQKRYFQSLFSKIDFHHCTIYVKFIVYCIACTMSEEFQGELLNDFRLHKILQD